MSTSNPNNPNNPNNDKFTNESPKAVTASELATWEKSQIPDSWFHRTAKKWDHTFSSVCAVCRSARAWVEISAIVLCTIAIGLGIMIYSKLLVIESM